MANAPHETWVLSITRRKEPVFPARRVSCISRGFALGAVVSALISMQVEAKDKTFYNNGEFEKILHRAGAATKSNNPQTEDGFVPIFAARRALPATSGRSI